MRTFGRPAGRRVAGRGDYKLLGLALILLALVLASPAGASASSSTGSAAASVAGSMVAKATPQKTAGRVIVKYQLSESVVAARTAAAEAGAQVVDRIRTYGLKTTGRYFVVSSDTLSTRELMKTYRADPAVEYVEPDYVVRADAAVTPNDPLFADLWGLSKISAPLAWGVSTGQAGVVVADIDTGVDYTHPDLAANMWHNSGEIPDNGIDDDGNGHVDDVYGIDAADGTSDPWDLNGHGTHTSGTVAAVGNNATGVTGVCWTARIMALRFMDSSGQGYISDAITCINYMISEKLNHGVNVVAANNSWGGLDYSQALHDAIASAGDAGIVCACAAGNGGSDDIGDNNDVLPFYPASYDCSNIISVAATDNADALASFSNWGATSVDLAAPGVGIVSTLPTSIDSDGYASWNGTSMATPFVTGAVALMAAAYPAESMTTRISEIESTVDPVADLTGMVASGGRLDLAAALYREAATISGFTPGSGGVGTSVTLTGTGFSGATSVKFNGTSASFTVDSATQITATVPAGATTGTIAVTTPGGTATSATSFTVIPAPTITRFTPTSGKVGSGVTLTGSDFSGATSVKFNGTSAAFDVVSDTQVTTTVPVGATTGTIAVTTPAGTATSATSFTVMPAPPKPKIARLSSTSGRRGVAVVITGTGFGTRRGTSYVKFGVTKCTKYLSWSKTRIKCRVPAKARFGYLKVKVTTAAGASNAKSFRVRR